MLSANTTITVGTVEKVTDTLKGTSNEIEISLNIPIIALEGDNVGIARNIDKHWRLIGFWRNFVGRCIK